MGLTDVGDESGAGLTGEILVLEYIRGFEWKGFVQSLSPTCLSPPTPRGPTADVL